MQQHMLVEHLGSRLDGKQRNLIELEAHILNILTGNFYSPASVCQRRSCLLLHDLLAFGIYSLHLLLNPFTFSHPLVFSHSIKQRKDIR